MFTVLTIIVFILILGVMILVHEFGHFIAARIVGITVEEFSIGMGPVIWSKVKKKVKYSIRALPIGGFLRMLGEDDMDLRVKGSFGSKSPWQRLFVVSAGVIMNFLLVVVIGYIMGLCLNFQYRFPLLFNKEVLIGQEIEKPVIVEVSENSPADISGLSLNEVVIAVDNQTVDGVDQFISYVNDHAGEELTLEIGQLYKKETRKISLTPRTDPPEGEGAMGVRISSIGFVEYPGPAGKAASGLFHAVNLSAYNGVIFGQLVKISFQERTVAPISEGVSGPIGLFYIIRSAIEAGAFVGVLDIMAVIGVSLVLINLLPIPALDGGYILFLLIEGISRKRLPGKALRWITQAGMIFLILLILFVAAQDIIKYTPLQQGFCNAYGWFCP